MTAGEDRRAHWERVFTERAPADVSWFEAAPRASLELIDALGVGPGAGVVDVGGGASRLAAALVARGFSDVTNSDQPAASCRATKYRPSASGGITSSNSQPNRPP